MNKFIIKITCIVGLIIWTSSVFAEIAIIANSKSSATLDAKAAKKLFLGKTSKVSGTTRVVLVGQTDNSPTKAEFTKKITNKSLGKYKAYWSKLIFSGKAVPPKELASDADVIAFVSKNANAIGYIDGKSVTGSIKVLLRVP